MLPQGFINLGHFPTSKFPYVAHIHTIHTSVQTLGVLKAG